jgi:hypothetical protein
MADFSGARFVSLVPSAKGRVFVLRRVGTVPRPKTLRHRRLLDAGQGRLREVWRPLRAGECVQVSEYPLEECFLKSKKGAKSVFSEKG